MTRCRIPEFCERYKTDIRIYDNKCTRILPRALTERNKCLYSHKDHYCVIWKKNKSDSLNRKDMEDFVNKKFGELPISKNLQEIDITDLLFSHDFNSIYLSAKADKHSTSPAIETRYFFKRNMSDTVCKMINSGRWNEENGLLFQQLNIIISRM